MKEGKKFCPQCGSEEVETMEHEDMDETTRTLICSECGYSGKEFPEKHLIGEAAELEDDEDEMPVKKKIIKKATKKKVKKGSKK